jgi:ATP-binding cassette subfamily B protein
MMAFMQYSMQIVMSFLMLTMIFIFLPRASVSANRINEVLETELSIKDPENPKILTEKVKGLLEFKNVCFRYPGADADALSNLNFTAEPGQTTAIIGATGAGKSTTVNLIPRFYDVSEGEILLDGDNIKDLAQQDLRNQIGYVPQKITLFSGTIESNLRYADENASDEIIREAAETAQAMEFINDKEEKFEAPISQAGTNISGGQKQRLSIARALVKKFPVFIFDDSFSALDFRTDAALRWAMKEKTGDSTLIIIAQRISTIMNAEQIIVLDEGKIVGKGTHRELLASCEEYKEIALSQLEMKELA